MIAQKYMALGATLKEPTLIEQVRSDLKDVERLIEEYEARLPEPGSDWFKRADRKRAYLQELGLRYSELSTAKVGGG